MYPYHNKIKQRIANDELIRAEFVTNYKNITPCLLLYFKTKPFIRPIRTHRFNEYIYILENCIFIEKENIIRKLKEYSNSSL